MPAEVLATLAVIEQTDDTDFIRKKTAAFDDVLSQYGLKREEAYRYSVSSAAALGPMHTLPPSSPDRPSLEGRSRGERGAALCEICRDDRMLAA